MRCSTCHQAEHNTASGVPGKPNWHLAPLPMGWGGPRGRAALSGAQRSTDTAGFCEWFNAGRNVDAVSVDAFPKVKDVSKMQTDPDLDAAILCRSGVSIVKNLLDLDGTARSGRALGNSTKNPSPTASISRPPC